MLLASSPTSSLSGASSTTADASHAPRNTSTSPSGFGSGFACAKLADDHRAAAVHAMKNTQTDAWMRVDAMTILTLETSSRASSPSSRPAAPCEGRGGTRNGPRI